MDEELRLLQTQFFAAQEVRSSVRLSERNVVELVNKLQQLGMLEEELLHTLNGKEYITQARLQEEVVGEVGVLGRVSLVDLASTLAVDLFYVERAAQQIAASDPRVALVQGEILTSSYWDGVAEEVQEALQECGQISMAEIAKRFNVGSDLLGGNIQSRMGSLIRGKLDGGQLFTPDYVARVKAMVRGALRALTLSTPTSQIASTVDHLQVTLLGGVGGAAGGLFATVLAECVAEGAAQGSMRGGGAGWTPDVFSRTQKASVEAFFSQNGYMSYSRARRVGVSQPKQFLEHKFSGGVALDTAFVGAAMVEQMDAAVEEATRSESWCDISPLLPASFSVPDAALLLSSCPSASRAGAKVMAQTCSVAPKLIQGLVDRFLARPAKGEEDGAGAGRPIPNEARGGGEDGSDEEGVGRGKGGKGRRRGGKGAKGKGGGPKGGKAGKAEAETAETAETEELGEMARQIVEWVPDLEGAGAGEEEGEAGGLAHALATCIRPAVLAAREAAKRAAFSAGAEERRRRREGLQREVEEVWGRLQLYGKGAQVFQDDPTTWPILERHLLRSTGAHAADLILRAEAREQQVAEGGVAADVGVADGQLSAAQRLALAKGLPAGAAGWAVALAQAMEGKSVGGLEKALERAGQETGLRLKRLDKKTEKALFQQHKKAIASQLEDTNDAVAALPLAITMLFAKVHSRLINAPGRSLSSIVSHLATALSPDAHKELVEYQGRIVEYISMNAKGGEDNQKSAHEILRELEAKLPALQRMSLFEGKEGKD